MSDNLIGDIHWRRAAKVIADVLYNDFERDWMDLAMCHVGDPGDTRFIRRPTADEDEQWGAVCAQCPVFTECWNWANKNDISGAYVAGVWRE